MGSWSISLKHGLLAVFVTLLGSVLGIIGAFFQELTGGGGVLLVFVGAPIIEEVLKPAGVYIVLVRWPNLLRSQLYTAAMAALSGLSFGIVESAIYVNVYFQEHSPGFVVYRFTVPVFLHTMSSFIIGFGINQRLMMSIKGEVPLLQGNKVFFITAIVLHSIYNIAAFTLETTGHLDFGNDSSLFSG